ncbi:hypothetical protein C8R47DRAFT_302839 [Mycena vitilis]|nr:hypothetical protein C8R47DRAFT_302839 [Mycena vitilis]
MFNSQGQIWTTFNGTNHFFLSLILLWLLQTPGGVDSSGNIVATMRRTGGRKSQSYKVSRMKKGRLISCFKSTR